MKKKHLIWIIPVVILTLTFVFLLGLLTGMRSVEGLVEVVEDIDECCMDTLTYAMEHNQDCEVLITGYMAKCVE